MLDGGIDFTMRDIIFGIVDADSSNLNLVILHAKYFNDGAKCNEKHPNINAFINTMKTCKETEKCIATRNGTLSKWYDRWKNVKC